MPFLLMVFLTVACLPKWDSQPPGWVDSIFWSAVLTWLGVALIGLEAFWSARRVRRAVECDPDRRDRAASRYERGRFARQLLLLGVYAWLSTASIGAGPSLNIGAGTATASFRYWALKC